MPFGKRKRGNKIEVYNKDTGQTKGTHDDEAGADKQLAALHANDADKDKKSLGDTVIRTKAASATIEDTSQGVDDYPGTFAVVLSSPKLDRDGEQLMPDEWELPLPEQITFVNDHTHKMASVVGSARPTLEGAQIIARGTWAETDNAQDTRKIVRGKHVNHVSVAYREKRNHKSGSVSRELINGSFVVIPSNTDARVLASKDFTDELSTETKEFIKSIVTETLSVSQEFPAPEAQPLGSDSSADQENEGTRLAL